MKELTRLGYNLQAGYWGTMERSVGARPGACLGSALSVSSPLSPPLSPPPAPLLSTLSRPSPLQAPLNSPEWLKRPVWVQSFEQVRWRALAPSSPPAQPARMGSERGSSVPRARAIPTFARPAQPASRTRAVARPWRCQDRVGGPGGLSSRVPSPPRPSPPPSHARASHRLPTPCAHSARPGKPPLLEEEDQGATGAAGRSDPRRRHW